MSYYAVTAKMIEAADAYFAENDGLTETLERLREQYPFEYCLRADIKLRESKERQSYREALVGERLTGVEADPEAFASYAMKWGVVNEPLALALYQLKSRQIIAPAPLLLHPEWKCGATPDSFVTDPITGLLGNVEVKCLKTANHLYKIIRDQTVPGEYIPQIQMQLWISGRDFCDFVGYDSRLPDGLEIYIRRVERDDFYIDQVLMPAIRRFLEECDDEFRYFWVKTTEKGRATARLVTPELATQI